MKRSIDCAFEFPTSQAALEPCCNYSLQGAKAQTGGRGTVVFHRAQKCATPRGTGQPPGLQR